MWDLRRVPERGPLTAQRRVKDGLLSGSCVHSERKKAGRFLPSAASLPPSFATPVLAGTPTVSPKGLLKFLGIQRIICKLNTLLGVVGFGYLKKKNLRCTVYTCSLLCSLKSCCSWKPLEFSSDSSDVFFQTALWYSMFIR